KQLLGSFNFISYLDVTTEIADKAAELSTKAGDKLKNIDSIHLATALSANADTFWTNDHELASVKVEGLEIKSLRKYSSG
ncbi:MAG TPA: PIN domain-containing protein, partial [Puia sp.]|nr:PIN domain-containing protein [Puia sp.]